MYILHKNYFSFLAFPIHKKHFGANKTWRGMIFMPLSSALTFLLAKILLPIFFYYTFAQMFLVGLAMGASYVLFELPNSFLKRKCQIPPGETSKEYKYFFIWLDHTDSAVGCLLTYALMLHISLDTLLCTYLLGFILHLLINYFLFLLGLRKRAL
jgi:hypothetical protein